MCCFSGGIFSLKLDGLHDFFALQVTFSIRNVGQVMCTIVSVYYLAKYKYFAFIFSSINAKFYI